MTFVRCTKIRILKATNLIKIFTSSFKCTVVMIVRVFIRIPLAPNGKLIIKKKKQYTFISSHSTLYTPSVFGTTHPYRENKKIKQRTSQ